MKIFKLLVLSLASLVCSFWVINPVKAVTVSPVVVDHEVAPGMKASGKMMVTNDGQSMQTFYISSQSFVATGEEGEQQFLDKEETNSLPSWFKFNQTSYEVEAGKTVEIPYTINVPQDAEPGGHYAAVFFTTSPTNDSNEPSVSIAAKTGILFLVKVSGNTKESATIESYSVNQSYFSHLPAFMSLRIRNDGNVHLRPVGTLTVKNMWGGVVARVPANPKKSAVLPGSVRRMDTWWAKTTDVAKGGFMAGLSNEWRNFALGRYTATVDVQYGSQSTSLESKSVTFWVFPWRLGLITLAILLVLFVAMKIYNKSVVSSALKKS